MAQVDRDRYNLELEQWKLQNGYSLQDLENEAATKRKPKKSRAKVKKPSFVDDDESSSSSSSSGEEDEPADAAQDEAQDASTDESSKAKEPSLEHDTDPEVPWRISPLPYQSMPYSSSGPPCLSSAAPKHQGDSSRVRSGPTCSAAQPRFSPLCGRLLSTTFRGSWPEEHRFGLGPGVLSRHTPGERP